MVFGAAWYSESGFDVLNKSVAVESKQFNESQNPTELKTSFISKEKNDQVLSRTENVTSRFVVFSQICSFSFLLGISLIGLHGKRMDFVQLFYMVNITLYGGGGGGFWIP